MIKKRTSSVFVPGGMPEFTYVDRVATRLQDKLESTKDNLCKLVTLTGQTKSGKTVLAQRVFPDLDETNIWIDGGSISTEEDLWSQVVEKLNGWTTETESDGSESSQNLEGEISGEANAIFVKGKGKAKTGLGRKQATQTSRARQTASKPKALTLLRESASSLIIDDFHYIPRELQGPIVRAIKPLVFRGFPVVLIAIPHRRYDAIKVEREMTGRLEDIQVPYWQPDELKRIPELGFPLLNIEVSDAIVDRLTKESQSSPHLMQEFCRELCREYEIKETIDTATRIDALDDELFSNVAEATGKVIFDRLATGPRQRTDRMQRRLKSGDTADIYKVVLLSLARLKPGMQTIQYEELRASVRDILDDNLPQAHEISRVLEKMSEIASSDEASTPVIDWEKDDQKLHVTDPFFAFFLRWGTDPT